MTLSSRLAAAAFLFLTLTSAAIPTQPCPKKGAAHIIGVRGNSKGPPVPYGGLTTQIVGLKEAIPGSTNVSVQYPKKQQPGSAKNPGAARKHLTYAIESKAAQCPDSPIILTGYSEGALTIMNLICGTSNPMHIINEGQPFDPKYTAQIVAINLYGDESRTAGQPYNEGTCQTFGPDFRTNPDGCDAYASTIKSWCDAEDLLCCAGGTSKAAHGKYPKEYDDDAIQWGVDQVAAFYASS